MSKLSKKIKKLGYGVAIHYNEYTKIHSVYKIGEYSPSSNNIPQNARYSESKKIKKAIKKYRTKFL